MSVVKAVKTGSNIEPDHITANIIVFHQKSECILIPVHITREKTHVSTASTVLPIGNAVGEAGTRQKKKRAGI